MTDTTTVPGAPAPTAPVKTVEIDGQEVAYDSLPVQSIVSLMQRGINHVLGNEVASKVSTAKKATKGGDGADKDEPKHTEADLEKIESDAFAAKVKAIYDGTLGVRPAGATRLSARDKAIREVAWLMIENSPNVKTGKVKLPSGKGSGEARKVMIDNLLGNEKLRGLAEAKADARLKEEAELGALLS